LDGWIDRKYFLQFLTRYVWSPLYGFVHLILILNDPKEKQDKSFIFSDPQSRKTWQRKIIGETVISRFQPTQYNEQI